MLWRMTLTY